MAAVLAFGVVASDTIPIMETMLPLRFCKNKLKIVLPGRYSTTYR